MLSKIVILGLIFVIGLLVFFLFRDSLKLHKMEKAEKPSGIRGKIGGSNVKLLNGPVIYYKCPGEKEYKQVAMEKRKIRIGKGSKNDIDLDDNCVEECHAVLEQKITDNSLYYELIDLSKCNPIEYFDQKEGNYGKVGYKKGVVLDGKEAFYIGETKVIIVTPEKAHAVSKTERLILNGDDQFGKLKKPAVNEESRKTQIYRKETETDATVETKREPTFRVVSCNEIDI